jgi:hypothetical protein
MAKYVITGRIYDIVHVSDKVAQIVLKKKDRDKIILVAINVVGYWRDKAINEMNLKKKDKIRGNVFVKSEWYEPKKRYYTDNTFREIYLVEPAPVEMAKLFKDKEWGNVDTSSGEVLQ